MTTTVRPDTEPTQPRTLAPVSRLELEITKRCQLSCGHCFAKSGPAGSHGAMRSEDWRRVIRQAAEIGTTNIQLIGGELTTHPAWLNLLDYALSCGQQVEVFSNLYRIRPQWWTNLTHPRVTLACSYYSDHAEQHDAITGRIGSHLATRTNIARAVELGIPLRVEIVDMRPGQRAEEAAADLRALGVTRVHTDRLRGIGRAAHRTVPALGELCGRCGDGRAAVGPNGDVWPCVLARSLPVGNVLTDDLGDILTGEKWQETVATVPRRQARACNPDSDGDDCSPAEQDACPPSYG